MIRILHTADWHLGVSVRGTESLLDDHRAFLAWVAEWLDEEPHDVLLVSGDLFHHSQPGADAQRALYDGLAALHRRHPALQVILTAGNHDSASRIGAARELLALHGLHMRGEVDMDQPADALIPVQDASGETVAVVAAVPYMHEYRFGATTLEGYSARLQEGVARWYGTLADLAHARWPGVPRVAMGHLTVGLSGSAATEDCFEDVHRVGMLGALPPTVFSDAWDYVALGHIHRAFPPEKGRIHYSGTPVPVRFEEPADSRQVLSITLDGGKRPATVTSVKVPAFRDWYDLQGPTEVLMARVRNLTLTAGGDARPLVRLRVEVDTWSAGLERDFEEALAKTFGRAPLLDFSQARDLGADAPAPAGMPAPLRHLTPREVFVRLWQRSHQGADPPDDILALYDQAESLQPQERA
jgi:exonuclease SbcD